jgi:hypothetical protein
MTDPVLAAQLQNLIAQFQQNANALPPKDRQITRRKFTPDEDDLLRNVVAQCGTGDWNLVAQNMQSRTARQCRERWRNYVSPEVLTGHWSREDEDTLLAKVGEMGPRWATIAQLFPGRTDIGVKNHYISIAGKKLKEISQSQAANATDPFYGDPAR